jgi:hypothetical protein
MVWKGDERSLDLLTQAPFEAVSAAASRKAAAMRLPEDMARRLLDRCRLPPTAVAGIPAQPVRYVESRSLHASLGQGEKHELAVQFSRPGYNGDRTSAAVRAIAYGPGSTWSGVLWATKTDGKWQVQRMEYSSFSR